MPEGNIGGKFKSIDEADKGIAEMEKVISQLQSERDTFRNKFEDVVKPKFADDTGFEKFVADKQINVSDLLTKAFKGEIGDKDTEVIGTVLKEADPKWLGKQFAQLKAYQVDGTIKAAQRGVVEKLGGEAAFGKIVEKAKAAMKPEEFSQWNAKWTDPKQSEDAAWALVGRFGSGEVRRSPTETSFSAGGGTSGHHRAFASKDEFVAARAESIKKYGPDHFKVDAEFMARYQATPKDVRATFF